MGWAPNNSSSGIDLRVEVDRTELLSTLKKNLNEHSEVAGKARESFQSTLVQFLEKVLETAKKGKDISDMYIDLPRKPYNHIEEYERIIGMVELATTEKVWLSAKDYKHFFMDEWSWKEGFMRSSISAGYKT